MSTPSYFCCTFECVTSALFLLISGSPAVHLERNTSNRNTVTPLNITMKDPDHSLELDKILLPNENSKGERLCHGALKMLSRGKGASIFDAIKLKETETGAIDRELLSAEDNEGFTLLHHASRCNKVDEVIWLLNRGVEIDALGNNGLTALNIAVRYDLVIISKRIDVICKNLSEFRKI